MTLIQKCPQMQLTWCHYSERPRRCSPRCSGACKSPRRTCARRGSSTRSPCARTRSTSSTLCAAGEAQRLRDYNKSLVHATPRLWQIAIRKTLLYHSCPIYGFFRHSNTYRPTHSWAEKSFRGEVMKPERKETKEVTKQERSAKEPKDGSIAMGMYRYERSSMIADMKEIRLTFDRKVEQTAVRAFRPSRPRAMRRRSCCESSRVCRLAQANTCA